MLSGTPTTAGTYGFTVAVTDAAGHSTSQAYCIVDQPRLHYVALLDREPRAMSYQFPASSDIPPFTFAVTAGTLPMGLTLNSQNGVLSGTPTTPGYYTFTVSYTDGWVTRPAKPTASRSTRGW